MDLKPIKAGVGGVKPRPEVKKPTPAVTSPAPRSPMKASMLEAGSDDDLFSGTTRNYGSTFNKSRPTMISAKYRLKEERRKVLKISINKLKKIEDPESSLRRSVLINNTMKRLQKEAREERREKQQIHSFPRYTPSYKSFVLREEPPKQVEEAKPADSRLKPDANKENASPFPSERKHASKASLDSCFCDETMEELVDVTSLDEELSRPLEELADPVNLMETASATIDDVATRCASRKRSFDEDVASRPLEALTSLMDDVERTPTAVVDESSERARATRKRSYEEVEDSEIHDVLSQFYMPPTPRMLTSIDEDEDEEVNVVDIDMESPIVTKVLGFEELVRDELDEELLVKRARFDAPAFDATSPSFNNSSCDVKTPSFGFMNVVSTKETRTCEKEDASAPGEDAVKEVDKENLQATCDRRTPITRLAEAVSWTSLLSETRTEEYKYSKALSDCCYSQESAADPSKYSCAHAAITELQSQVYHNYVTSLES